MRKMFIWLIKRRSPKITSEIGLLLIGIRKRVMETERGWGVSSW